MWTDGGEALVWPQRGLRRRRTVDERRRRPGLRERQCGWRDVNGQERHKRTSPSGGDRLTVEGSLASRLKQPSLRPDSDPRLCLVAGVTAGQQWWGKGRKAEGWGQCVPPERPLYVSHHATLAAPESAAQSSFGWAAGDTAPPNSPLWGQERRIIFCLPRLIGPFPPGAVLKQTCKSQGVLRPGAADLILSCQSGPAVMPPSEPENPVDVMLWDFPRSLGRGCAALPCSPEHCAGSPRWPRGGPMGGATAPAHRWLPEDSGAHHTVAPSHWVAQLRPQTQARPPVSY